MWLSADTKVASSSSSNSTVSLPGLCPSTELDRKFAFTGDFHNAKHSFSGFSGSKLTWMNETREWKVTAKLYSNGGDIYGQDEVYATTEGDEYPIGKIQKSF